MGCKFVATTFVADTREFRTGTGSILFTVLQTSANAWSCVVFTSGKVIAVDVVVVVVLPVVKVMHVLIEGRIGMIGITTEMRKMVFK